MLRKRESKAHFSDDIYENIDSMYKYLHEALEIMLELLRSLDAPDDRLIAAAYNKEREINNMRNQLRSANVENINEHQYQYQAGIYYMDVVSDIERTGDYITNVVDTIKDTFRIRKPARP